MGKTRKVKAIGGKGVPYVIDYYDQPEYADAKGFYMGAGKYAKKGFKNKPGERVPKSGAYAEIGLGKLEAQASFLSAEARGPNAAVACGTYGGTASAMARAELAGAELNAGVFTAKATLAADTGAAIGDSVELRLMGTGFSIGRSTNISIFGITAGFHI